MADHRHRLAGVLWLAALVATPSSAQARVQPYQITRLITFKTECRIDKVEERPATGGKLHFVATCENVSFYPDDDRSCETTTRAKSFDSLHLLNPAR